MSDSSKCWLKKMELLRIRHQAIFGFFLQVKNWLYKRRYDRVEDLQRSIIHVINMMIRWKMPITNLSRRRREKKWFEKSSNYLQNPTTCWWNRQWLSPIKSKRTVGQKQCRIKRDCWDTDHSMGTSKECEKKNGIPKTKH